MAFDTVYLENPRTGQVRSAPIGFSWTTFFFGPFPMLFRSSFKWFAIIFLLAVFTWGLSSLVFMFIINRLYLNDLLKDGYKFKAAGRSSYDAVAAYARYPVPVLEPRAPTAA